MALPILLDCDPGHDDAIAIVLALASPELDVKAITSSAGNQTPEKTLLFDPTNLGWRAHGPIPKIMSYIFS